MLKNYNNFLAWIMILLLTLSNVYFYLNTPERQKIVTINVQKIIDHQVRQYDGALKNKTELPTERERQEEAEKWSQRITNAVKDFSYKNDVLILDKFAVIAPGKNKIEDITDEFLTVITK